MATLAQFLAESVRLARRNAEAGNGPFGALVVRDGTVLATGVNTAKRDSDPTAHAEVEAIRAACRRLGTTELAGAVVVASCEPCAMCQATAALAGIARIVYAAPKEVAANAGFGPAPNATPIEHVSTPGAEEPFTGFPRAEVAAPNPVRELRVALTVEDYPRALGFYRDVLGLPVREAWDELEGSGTILEAGRATLEVISVDQAELIDRVEVGQRVAGPVRLALEVADSERTARQLVAGGADPVAPAAETPWRHLNARVRAPDGMQLTLFTVLEGGS